MKTTYTEIFKNKPDRISGNTIPIKCIECDKVLGELITTIPLTAKPPMNEMKFQFICNCGGESFVYTTDKKAFFNCSPNLTVLDVKTVENKFIHTLKEYHE